MSAVIGISIVLDDLLGIVAVVNLELYTRFFLEDSGVISMVILVILINYVEAI